ncbi:MAG: BppU family phage baseplate upper protein, partial [Ruminococcus sp.]
MKIQHYKLNLDLLKQSSMPVIYGYQLDNKSRYVDITLTANGAEVTLDSDMTAVLNATTNNVIVAEAQSCNISGNLIEVELTDKVLSLPGAVKCEVVLSSSGTVITAQHFLVKVTEKAINNKSKFEPGGSALATKDDVATAKSEAISAADALLDEYDEAVISKLNLKADKATTLAGYGITDAYDKTYLDKALKNKLDKMPFDTVLVENSPNYVTSGTVYGAINTVNQTVATKYDSSNVEKGSGTLSPATSGSTGSEGNFIYSKNGNTVTVAV